VPIPPRHLQPRRTTRARRGYESTTPPGTSRSRSQARRSLSTRHTTDDRIVNKHDDLSAGYRGHCAMPQARVCAQAPIPGYRNSATTTHTWENALHAVLRNERPHLPRSVRLILMCQTAASIVGMATRLVQIKQSRTLDPVTSANSCRYVGAPGRDERGRGSAGSFRRRPDVPTRAARPGCVCVPSRDSPGLVAQPMF
jgi:hypothetical protein